MFTYKDLKSHQNRTSSFGAAIAGELAELLSRATPGERLFARPGGAIANRSWWSHKIRKARKMAGFEATGWTIRTWRHVGACTWLFDRGADSSAVSAALSHSSVSFTLDRYTGPRGSVARTLTLANETS